MDDADANEGLIVDGMAVDRRLLESRPAQHCRLEECQAYCCSGGVWIDVGQAAVIQENAERIKPYLPEGRRDELNWFDGYVEADPEYPSGYGMGTHVVPDPSHPAGTTCVFLLPDRKCALQAAAIAQGLHAWTWKPFYCCLHPITLDKGAVTLDDDNEIYIKGGSCQRPAQESIPLYALFKDELTLVLGAERYGELERVAQGKAGGSR